MNHLEAFMSDDAKRGRVWTCADGYAYRKCGPYIEYFNKDDAEWREALISAQRYASEAVTWADEPKTLTPQEALRALADGKVLRDKDLLWRLGDDGCIYTKYGSAPWEEQPSQSFNDWHILPDPSQQAEPIKAPLKVGDRVKRGPDWKWGSQDNSGAGSIIAGARPAGDGWLWVKWDDGAQEVYRYGAEGKYDIEKIEAKPQVGYPLTYAEAEALARRGAHVTNEMYPHVTYAVIDSVPRLRTNKGDWFGDGWAITRSEEVAKWRIVDGGK